MKGSVPEYRNKRLTDGQDGPRCLAEFRIGKSGKSGAIDESVGGRIVNKQRRIVGKVNMPLAEGARGRAHEEESTEAEFSAEKLSRSVHSEPARHKFQLQLNWE